MEKKIGYNKEQQYLELQPSKVDAFVEYIVYKTKLHDFSPLEKTIYVYDLLKECVDENIHEVCDIKKNLNIKIEDGKISSLSFPYIYSKVLEKLGIKTKLYYLFNLEETCTHMYIGRVVFLLNDPKYNITGVYINSTEYNDNKIIDDNSPYTNCFKTPVQADSVTKDLAFPIHDYMFEINFFKILNKKGLAYIDDTYFKELNNMSLFIDGNLLFPNYGYLPRTEFINDLLIYCDIQNIVDKVEEYYKLMGNTIGADELISAIYTVRKFEVYEGFNVELTEEALVDIVVSGNLMFERDVQNEIYNLDCSNFNKQNKITIHDFINENNWNDEMNKINMDIKKK